MVKFKMMEQVSIIMTVTLVLILVQTSINILILMPILLDREILDHQGVQVKLLNMERK